MHTTHLDHVLRSIYLGFHFLFHPLRNLFLICFLIGWTSLEPKVSMSEAGPRWLFRLTKKFGSIVLLALDVGTIPHSRFMFVNLFAAFLATVQVTLFLACLLDWNAHAYEHHSCGFAAPPLDTRTQIVWSLLLPPFVAPC
jgi:hypothetical protein